MALTKTDIDWLIESMKLEFMSTKEFEKKFDRIYELLDKQAGNIKDIQTELTLIRSSLDENVPEQLTKRLEQLEHICHTNPY